MSNNIRSEKIKIFIIGLMLGLLIGGSFFMFKLNSFFSDFKTLKNLVHNSKDTIVTVIPEQNNTPIVEKKTKNNFSDNSKVSVKKAIDTLAQKNNISKNKTDSITNDSLSNAANKVDNTDDIVVKKDELLMTKIISIVDLDAPLTKKQLKEDSLLAVVSDTKDEAIPLSYFQVEYWSSPLNYKGYKMSKNKILLYGMDLTADIKLFQKDGIVYLKLADYAYKMDYSDNFKQYEKITDKDFLAKLN